MQVMAGPIPARWIKCSVLCAKEDRHTRNSDAKRGGHVLDCHWKVPVQCLISCHRTLKASVHVKHCGWSVFGLLSFNIAILEGKASSVVTATHHRE